MSEALANHALGRDNAARADTEKAIETDARISLAQFGQLSLNKDRAAVEKGLAILCELGLAE